MTTSKSPSTAPHSVDLVDEVRQAAHVGQHAAAEALRAFRQTVDDAIPESVQPLRNKIVTAAIDLADALNSAQYQFTRNLIRSADRAVSTPTGEQNKTTGADRTPELEMD